MFPSGTSATAAEWKPHLDVSLMPGTERLIGRLDLFVPLRGSEDALWFADLRALVDNHDTFEGNLGVGYRRLAFADRWILGGYAFFDRRRSSGHNVFHQATVGFEALSRGWDLRSNFYLPETRKKKTGSVAHGARLQGNLVIGRVRQTTFYERALVGLDVEAGHPVKLLPRTRAYLGAYHFQGGGVPSVTGPRVRMEGRITDWLTLGSTLQWDRVRGTQGFFELRFRWSPFGRSTDPKERALARRMTDFVVRDVDIVAGNGSDTVEAPGRPVTDGAGNDQEIWYVKNDDGGADLGTFEAPFGTLAQAEAAAGPYDVIYVYEGDGTDTGQDYALTLQDDQRLIGSGVALRVGGYTLLPAGNRPTLTATGDTAVTLSDRNEVAGFTIDGADTGIFGTGVAGYDLRANRVLNSTTFGIGITDGTGTGRIRDNFFSSNGTEDLRLTSGVAFLSSPLVNGNTFAASGVTQNVFISQIGAGLVGATFTDNTFNGNNDGISIFTLTLGPPGFVSVIARNNVFATGGAGINAGTLASPGNSLLVESNTFTSAGNAISALSGNGLADIDILGNSITGANRGVDVSSVGVGTIDLTIDGNTIDQSTAHGVSVSTGTAGTASITNNVLTNSGNRGINVVSSAGANADLTIDSNRVTGSTNEGIRVRATGNSQTDARVADNTLSGNNGAAEDLLAVTVNNTTDLCLALSGNSSAGGFALEQQNTSTFDVEDKANLSALNGGGTVNLTENTAINDVAVGACTP